MNVTYVARSFLDYRVPVLAALSERLGGRLHLIYNAGYVPERAQAKARQVLGDRAIGMTGELRFDPNPGAHAEMANSTVRLVYQPGMMKAIAATRPDVLVADGFFQWTAFALAWRLRHGTPLVVCYERTFHTERGAQWFRRLYRHLALKLVDAMTVNGRLSLEYTQSLGMPRERITTGHMVADTDGLAAGAAALSEAEQRQIRQRWGEPDTVFIAVGKLNQRKGIKELLHGWSALERRHPGNWKLVLIGDGPDEDSLKALAAELGITGVIFHGLANYDEIARFYAAADVMVMPTLEDNWSLVVPEAMACGLPVLCSIHNGCHPELVHNDVNGWTFDPLDREDTVRALSACLDNRLRLPAMGEESRRIVGGHTPAVAAQAILDACHLALAHRQGTARAHPARP